MTAPFKELDTVVLDRDLPRQGLRKGDLGAVVQVYEPDGLEVEFVSASGRTEALVTLKDTDVRPVADGDLIAVGHHQLRFQGPKGGAELPAQDRGAEPPARDEPEQGLVVPERPPTRR